MYDDIYRWALAIGKRIIEQRREEADGEDLVRRIIYDIRGEELPGRFLNKLSTRLAEYRTNVNLDLDVGAHPKVFEEKLWGNKFYYVKSAIISGLTNALWRKTEEVKGE